MLNDEQPLLHNFKESTETVGWSIAMMLSKKTARELSALYLCASSTSSLEKTLLSNWKNVGYDIVLKMLRYEEARELKVVMMMMT